MSEAQIAKCRRGNRDALEQVFRAHAPALHRLILRLVGNPHEVEDLLQATFLAAITAFKRFRGEASVHTWLSRIAVNIVHQHWRSPARRRRVPLTLVPAEPGDDAAGLGRIDRVLDARRQLARVHEHLARIAPKKRIAFVLHVIDGRPVDEVAALTGASISATRSRIFWARRALKAKVARDPALSSLLTEWEERS